MRGPNDGTSIFASQWSTFRTIWWWHGVALAFGAALPCSVRGREHVPPDPSWTGHSARWLFCPWLSVYNGRWLSYWLPYPCGNDCRERSPSCHVETARLVASIGGFAFGRTLVASICRDLLADRAIDLPGDATIAGALEVPCGRDSTAQKGRAEHAQAATFPIALRGAGSSPGSPGS
jgi:hypothetical protein